MSTGETHPLAAKAAAQFNQREGRTDGLQIADRLTKNLSTVRALLLRRLLTPEKIVSQDSMLLPVSKLKAQQLAAEEVEAFLVAESVEAVRIYALLQEEGWYVDWLCKLRFEAWSPLSDIPGRVAAYLEMSPDERRLQFSNVLVETIPEARRAPLVLFRLLPDAIHFATVRAWDNPEAAEKIRAEQIKILPSITYCQECHGSLLDDGQECSTCGNPLWNQKWLCEVY